MEKEENQKSENDVEKKNIDGNEELVADSNDRKSNNQITDKEEIIEKTSEEKILELEDKLARTFAEMENQRRRFEKEKDEAFEYGGFTLAKESLNLIDNLDRSKQILKNDDTLKNSKALVKILEHLDIIYKCSKDFLRASVFFNFSSVSKTCFERSKLSIKFNASLAKLKPPYSNASSFSFSNLLL